MKAEITETGELIITPENGTESFALKVWFYGYNSDEGVVPIIKPTIRYGEYKKEIT